MCSEKHMPWAIQGANSVNGGKSKVSILEQYMEATFFMIMIRGPVSHLKL